MDLTPLPLDTPATIPLSVPGGEARVYTDDDAVADMAWSGDHVVEVSRAGVLILRDPNTLAVTARLVGPVPARGVTVVDDGFYLLFDGGQLVRFDPAARTVTAERPLGGELVYLGDPGGGPTAVTYAGGGRHVARFRSVKLETGGDRRFRVRRGQRSGTLARPPVAGMHEGTLYLAWDWGEFGGARYAVDLRTHRSRALDAGGALGFAEVGGQLLAFGGLQHMGMWSSFVSRADGAEERFTARGHATFSLNPARPAPEPPPPTAPDAPITLLAASANGRVAVVAHGKIWETDPTFSSWVLRAEPGLHAYGGRAYSVGVTPASTALRIEDDGTIVHGSSLDGVIRIHPDSGVERIGDTHAGGTYGDGLESVGDDVHARRDCALWPLGTSAPPPIVAPEHARQCWWDRDAGGALRVAAVVGQDIVSVSAAAPDEMTRLPMPVPDAARTYQTPALARAGDQLILGDRVGTRVWDGARWYDAPALAGFESAWDELAPVPGSTALLLHPESRRLLRVPDPGGNWTVVATAVTDALVQANGELVTATDGKLAVDGCDRLWRVGEGLAYEDALGIHPIERPRGMWAWADITALPDGVAVGGAGLHIELRVVCDTTPAPG